MYFTYSIHFTRFVRFIRFIRFISSIPSIRFNRFLHFYNYKLFIDLFHFFGGGVVGISSPGYVKETHTEKSVQNWRRGEGGGVVGLELWE